MNLYQLAQLNIAKMKYDLDSPELTEFVENLDVINALAEISPGFVWRLQTEDGDATGIDFFGANTLVNMSIWENIESLHNYVYRTSHAQIMGKRKQWFHKMKEVYTVLWWVEKGHIHSLEEAEEHLNLLRTLGPTAQAFNFKNAYPAPDDDSDAVNDFDDLCPAT